MPAYKQTLWLKNISLVAILVVVLWALDTPIAHAQATTFVGSVQEGIARVMALAIQLMQLLTWVLFSFMTFLLDPRFFLSIGANGDGESVSTLLDMLNDIWQLSRDLMNVIFAFALVFTAVYTVITAQKDFVTQHARKFVMAVVLVNFSWFVPQVILDISSVATATVYGIPSLLPAGDECQLPNGDPCTIVTNVKYLSSPQEVARLTGAGWRCILGDQVCFKEEPFNEDNVSSQNAILSGLIVNHGRLPMLARVARPITATGDRAARELLVFFVREAIILIISIALFFPLLAMTVAFCIRIPVLWITMAFMPFALLDWVVPNEQFHQGIPAKLRDQFIKAAFLPAFVAVPLTVGFILINAGSKLDGGNLAEIPFPIMDQLGNFWQVLWLFLSLAVLYTGVFSVLKKQDGILSKGASAIEGFGKNLGQLALSAPLSREIIPFVSGGTIQQSPIQALNAMNPRLILQNLRTTGSLRPNSGPTLDRQLDAADGLLRRNRSDLDQLNTRIRALERSGNDAEFSTNSQAVITELRRLNVNVADNRQLAFALRGANRRNGEVLAPNALLNRLERPAGGTGAPATPPVTPPVTPPTP